MSKGVARIVVAVAGVMLTVAALGGQTVITPPNNKYTPLQDVELGRKAASEVEKTLPFLREADVTSMVASVGRRLVDSIPRDLRHSEFRYTFQVVNVREINAFALPGGPMYINRGMIEAAHTQGEVASVMAHELSHVALRHGTAQATKATKYKIGTLLGAVVGSIIGGNVGTAVAQGTQFGLGTAFLRFSREFERQADLLGSHIMAAAGYDPLEMASMFKTIEKQGGSGGPQWLSDHPNPGDRYADITREAKLVTVNNRVSDTRAFTKAQARLQKLAPAPTTEAATRKTAGRGSVPVPDGPLEPGRVAPPSPSFTVYAEGDVFRVSVPSNWRELPRNDAVTFAPDGAYRPGGRTRRLHSRCRDRNWPRRSARPAHRDRRAHHLACAHQPGPRSSLFLRSGENRRPAGPAHRDLERVDDGPARAHRGVHRTARRRQPLIRAWGRAPRPLPGL